MAAETVESYADVARDLWMGRINDHGSLCPCLVCSDYRAFLNWPEVLTVFTLEEEQAS